MCTLKTLLNSLFILFTLTSLAQTNKKETPNKSGQIAEEEISKPSINFSQTHSISLHRKKEDQEVPIEITSSIATTDEQTYVVQIEIEQEGENKAISFNQDDLPVKFTFGKNFPKKYQHTIKLLGDTSTAYNLLRIKLYWLKNEREKIELSKRLLFYEPFKSETIPTSEKRFFKSVEDLKSDISTLRSQILDGDTSRTYIGKLLIGKKVRVIPYSGICIKNMLKLEEIISKGQNVKVIPYTDEYTKPSVPTENIPVKNPQDASSPKKKDSEKALIADIKTPPSDTTALVKKEPSTASASDSQKPTLTIMEKEIDSVVVRISEGMIEYLKITTKKGDYFYNQYAPVHLLDIEKRFDDKLFNPRNGSYIFLKDAVNFIADRRFNFFPNDGTYYLRNDPQKPKENEIKLFANGALNSFIDFRVFTDLLGALDNQANGLLQFEAKSKVYLHRKNIPNTFLYTFSCLEPYLGISKFDSKYDTTKIASSDTTINRMNLFQRSFLNVGLKLSVLKWDFRPSNSLYLNAGYQFNTSNVSIRDQSNTKDSIATKAIFHSPFFEVGLSSKRLNNFGFDAEAKYIFQLLNENSYFLNTGYNHLMNFSVSMFYYPGIKPKDKFFVRFSNYLNFKDRKEDFYQLQFGYSLNLKLNH